MKIGIYSPYLDTLGGGERYMLTIASCLSSTHQVELFWDDTSIRQRARAHFSIDLDSVRIVPNIFSRSSIQRIVLSSHYDALFVLSDGSIPISFCKKTIIHFQQPFKNVKGAFFNRLKLISVSSVICNSEFTKKFIDCEYKVNSRVVYPPVQTSSFINTQFKKNVILSVGRFHPVKKHEVMIDVFNTISPRIPEWKLVFAGGLMRKDKTYFDKISTSASPNILFYPDISFDMLQNLYKDAAVYWHAAGFGENSSLHPERMEHFGISPVEAMSAGCIPLLFIGGGLSEIVTHGSDGFLWNQAEQLADFTLRLVNDEKMISILRKKAEQRSKQFTVELFNKKIHSLLT